jgi:hypothetical protein
MGLLDSTNHMKCPKWILTSPIIIRRVLLRRDLFFNNIIFWQAYHLCRENNMITYLLNVLRTDNSCTCCVRNFDFTMHNTCCLLQDESVWLLNYRVWNGSHYNKNQLQKGTTFSQHNAQSTHQQKANLLRAKDSMIRSNIIHDLWVLNMGLQDSTNHIKCPKWVLTSPIIIRI